MQIIRDQPDSTKGPAERFTGDVYVDAVVDASVPARNHPALADRRWRHHGRPQAARRAGGHGA
jgi:hypothetical protein